MGRFSQTFVAYHGCGNCYQDGTNKIVPKNRKCIQQIYNPFWKKPGDVCNKVETRAQSKIKQKQAEIFNADILNGLKCSIQTSGIGIYGNQIQIQILIWKHGNQIKILLYH